MVHKSSIIPGLSQFLDMNVLSHYPPTSIKRIIAAGALALYLKQSTSLVDTLISNPLIAKMGVANNAGMIDIETLRDTYKNEIAKAGFMRIHIPMLGDIDFTADDLDTLYNCIVSVDSSTQSPVNTSTATFTPSGNNYRV
jgi:hypothetical protein